MRRAAVYAAQAQVMNDRSHYINGHPPRPARPNMLTMSALKTARRSLALHILRYYTKLRAGSIRMALARTYQPDAGAHNNKQVAFSELKESARHLHCATNAIIDSRAGRAPAVIVRSDVLTMGSAQL